LGISSMILYRKEPNNPIGLERRMVDTCIWDNWLYVIGLSNLIDNDSRLSFDYGKYIEETGAVEINQQQQHEYMLNFLKYIEQDWGYNWNQLLFDIDQDSQTKRDWENSYCLLKEYLKLGLQ